MNKKVLYLVHGAVIAALYVVLTLLANALGLANYAIQVRFSEALTILPVFTPAAIPGLFLGCIISNTPDRMHAVRHYLRKYCHADRCSRHLASAQ